MSAASPHSTSPRKRCDHWIDAGLPLEDIGGTLTQLDALWTDDQVRMNERGCDPDGRFYCESMAMTGHPGAGALYRLDPDRPLCVVLKTCHRLERT
jgi:sugar lactone lactonase YvrE